MNSSELLLNDYDIYKSNRNQWRQKFEFWHSHYSQKHTEQIKNIFPNSFSGEVV